MTRSPHVAFWRQGYRAVMATDTACQRYLYYHTAEDTPDKVNFPRLAEAAVAQRWPRKVSTAPLH